MEGDSCKLAVWTGRAPLSDHRVIMKSNNLEVKQLWVKRIRELIQEKYLYMEVALCEAGHRSNRNSKEFDMDPNEFINGGGHHGMSGVHINDNFSSAASNASSGTKVSDVCSFSTDSLLYTGSLCTILILWQLLSIIKSGFTHFCGKRLTKVLDGIFLRTEFAERLTVVE